MEKEIMWTLIDAIELIRQLNDGVQKCGYVFGLTGSVLFKGESQKDLDLILYPWSLKDHPGEQNVRAFLASQGWICEHVCVNGITPSGGLREDDKHVEIWKTSDGKRIDIFWLDRQQDPSKNVSCKKAVDPICY